MNVTRGAWEREAQEWTKVSHGENAFKVSMGDMRGDLSKDKKTLS